MNFFIHDPLTGEAYSRDPRNIARKAEAYLEGTGIADTAYFGPEAEFYIFDSVRFETRQNAGFYYIDSEAGAWNTGTRGGGNLGYKPRYKGGYFPVPPYDHFADLRDEMVIELEKAGLLGRARPPRGRHRRPGRDQLQVRHAAQERRQPDDVQVHRQERRLAQRQDRDLHAEADLRRQRLGHALPPVASGRTASRCSTTRPATPACRDMARYYIGGLLKHAPSLLAFTNPTVNSYHRLVPGFEAPVNLVYSQRNRSACIRIPITGTNPKAKRIEFRCPDPSSNPYLAFSAMLMAGLDGIKNKIEPPEPVDKDLYELPPDEHADIDAGARLAGRGARRARGRPRLPARGWRVHPGPDRDVDRLQARQRDRPDRAAPAPARVRALLRHLEPD